MPVAAAPDTCCCALSFHLSMLPLCRLPPHPSHTQQTAYNKQDAHGKSWSDPKIFDAPLTQRGRQQVCVYLCWDVAWLSHAHGHVPRRAPSITRTVASSARVDVCSSHLHPSLHTPFTHRPLLHASVCLRCCANTATLAPPCGSAAPSHAPLRP